MGEQLITIVARTKSGEVMPFRVQEIISIDGKPYTGASDIDALIQTLNYHAGRIAAIENILSPKEG